MIVDLILDRKDGIQYNPKKMYDDILFYEKIFFPGYPISRAMDGGTESDVRRELCRYIDEQGYNTEIKDYINSVDWL